MVKLTAEAELRKKASDSTSEHTDPSEITENTEPSGVTENRENTEPSGMTENTEPSEKTASKVNAWIWPQNFHKTGMIYIDDEGEYWALTRPPQYTGPMPIPNFMCLMRIRSEFVPAYSSGGHEKIYDCLDEQAQKQPSEFDCPIKIWTPSEGNGFYIPKCMREPKTEEPKKPEALNPAQAEQPEKPMNSAQSKQPEESVKTAGSEKPEQMMQTEESEKSEAENIAQSERSEESVKTAAESGTESQAIKMVEAAGLQNTENPKLTLKDDELNKLGQSENPAKIKRKKIRKNLKKPKLIKKTRKALP